VGARIEACCSVPSVEPGVEDPGRIVQAVDATDRRERLPAGARSGPAERLQRRERQLGLLDGQPGRSFGARYTVVVGGEQQ
jgi:hypothetical protein